MFNGWGKAGLPAGSLGYVYLPALAILERAILRGPRPRPGADGLLHALATLRKTRDKLHRSDPRRAEHAPDRHPKRNRGTGKRDVEVARRGRRGRAGGAYPPE